MEKIVVSDIERLAHPEMDFVPVFGDGGQKHVAVAEDFFFFMNEFIDNIGDVFAFLEHDDWFRIFLAVVVSHAVVFSFFVFKNEAWTTNHTVGGHNIKFLCAFWSICPAFCFFNWGVAEVNWNVFNTIFTIALLEDDVAHAHGIAAKDGICIKDVVCFRHIFDDAAGTGVVGYAWLIEHFGETGGCIGHLFHFDLCNAGVWCCWLGAIDNVQVRAVAGWRPAGTRPMPNEGLHACFSGNVPQWFCVAETAVEVVTGGIQVHWILAPEASDLMSDWQCAGCQGCPQWWGDGWWGAE